jgi:hypothetical protein
MWMVESILGWKRRLEECCVIERCRWFGCPDSSPEWAVEAFLRADGRDVGARYKAPINVNAGSAAEEGVFGFTLYCSLYP